MRAALLRAFLAECLASDFAWGRADCCAFGADWALRLRGRDPMASRRGAYADARGAARLVAEAGGLVALVGRSLESIGARRLRRGRRRRLGDIVVADAEGRAVVGIVTAPGFVTFRAEHGLAGLRRPRVLARWAI